MIIYLKELKQSFKSLCIWTLAISTMLVICIFMFPEIKNEMDEVSYVFANMGNFTDAFGMDKLNFGEIMGFYGIECGNILSIGGGLFAALIGISVLANEEKDRTAEFLLTNPINRSEVIIEKFLSIITQIIIMNVFIVLVSILSFTIIGEDISLKEFLLLHVSYLILQIEISCICFGISAFIKGGSIGIGIGISIILYFLNIICNISEKAEFLRYITPFAYSEASDIILNSKLDLKLIIIGILISIIFVFIGFIKYSRKDIAS